MKDGIVARNINNVLMKQAKNTNLQFLKPRFDSLVVDSFLDRYEKSKDYTRSSRENNNSSGISYENQIQQKVYDFLKKNNIGYKDSNDMITLQSISYSLCQLIQYTNKFKNRFYHNSKSRFESCDLLKSVNNCMIIRNKFASKKLIYIYIY